MTFYSISCYSWLIALDFKVHQDAHIRISFCFILIIISSSTTRNMLFLDLILSDYRGLIVFQTFFLSTIFFSFKLVKHSFSAKEITVVALPSYEQLILFSTGLFFKHEFLKRALFIKDILFPRQLFFSWEKVVKGTNTNV